jgi:alkylhydroperoxidase family enzyme
MKKRYGDRVQFLGIYVREAHPADGWRLPGNDRLGIAIPQPRSTQERTEVAGRCCQALKMTMPLLVDEVDDAVGRAYSGMPDRLYVIGRDGRVVYKAGRGPFGFKTGEMEQSLVMTLLEQDAAPRTEGRLPVPTDGEAWKHLPRAEQGSGQPLPVWARALAPVLPRTTAAMLELDYRHRAASPLDAKLRAKMRWTAAHANRCAYAEAYALADLQGAGATPAEVAAFTANRQAAPDAERAALAFADKLTRAASTVTDEEVRRLRAYHGDAKVVAMVQLLAHANFQDRLLLTFAFPVEEGGPRPALEVRFAKPLSAVEAPPRRTPPHPQPLAPEAGERGEKGPPLSPRGRGVGGEGDAEWAQLDFTFLQGKLDAQRAREPRIPVPPWEEVRKHLPAGTPPSAKPLRIRWSLVCSGYQPELAAGWSACTRGFAEDARQDRVFEESLFWVVTRSLQCFY